ncbi:MAG: four helix bundle protein [Ignavibacteriaceae bacterium]
MKIYFDHEKIKVYQLSLEFINLVDQILTHQPKKTCVSDNLDRTSTSITLNISEGNGKYSSKDRCNFFDISRGSALESASCPDILLIKKLISDEEHTKGKELLHQIDSLIVGLIKSNSDRIHEPDFEYNRIDLKP